MGDSLECLDLPSMCHTNVLKPTRMILMVVIEVGKNTPLKITKLVVQFFLLNLQTSPISHFDRLNSGYQGNREKK